MFTSLCFLLINVAVIVDGTSVIQNETVRNLDMLIVSSCHGGILALDKDGITVVVHSNGNGTHNMTWDEFKAKWETHRIGMSDWKYPLNGAIIGSAIEPGNTKWDLFIDISYDSWDAVVSGDHIMRAPTQMCPSNKKYCGNDPEVQATGMTVPFTQPQKLLISCGTDGSITRVDICDHNCTSDRDNPGNAHCKCSLNLKLCGHQLHALGWGPEYDNDTLFLCLGGVNVTKVEMCSSGCVSTEKNSICYGNCTNEYFCGYKLTEMGVDRYDPNALYQCDASGRPVHIFANCSEGCIQWDSERAACLCHPGRSYCVHELYIEMNWWGLKETYAIQPHQIGICLPDKLTVEWGAICINCIESQGDKDAHCQWNAGVLCGRELNSMGFTGYEDDTLYQRGEEPGNTSIISVCPPGTCLGKTCDCFPTRTYCGFQLYSMGWLHINSVEAQGYLWQCTDGQHARMISQCRRCTIVEGRAKCACMDTELYCGYELDIDPPYNDNGVYQCKIDGGASLVKACNGSCIRVTESDNPNYFTAAPDCYRECTPGETYCGIKLLTIGYTGFNKNGIYICSEDGKNVIDTGQVDTLCTECTPGRSYCGHELSKIWHYSQRTLQTRFICGPKELT